MRIAKNKRLIIIVLCLIIAFFVVACMVCKLNNHKVIRLGVFVGSPWGVPDPYTFEFLDSAISKYEKEHPGISVEYVSGIQRGDYSEWLSGEIVDGSAPDVFIVLPEDFSVLQKVGALEQLDSIIEKDDDFVSDDFYYGAYCDGRIDNAQYALPLEAAPDLMFVNKTLLNSEGISVPDENWTWDELLTICNQLTKDTDGDGTIDQFGIYNYNWEHAFITNDAKVFETDGASCDLHGENVQQATLLIKQLERLKKNIVVTSADFDQGKVAFMPLTLAEYRTYKPYPWSIKKYSNFDWECIPLPKGPYGDNISNMNTLLMGMNSRTRNKKLSWELMKTFCYDKNIQSLIYKYRGGGAVLKSILNNDEEILIENQVLPESSDIKLEMIRYIMESGVPDYNFADFKEAKKMMDEGIEDIVENDKNPQIALKQLQREINKFLAN